MAGKQTILIVDDDAHIREVVGFALRKAGFGLVAAANGLEALARMDERAPELIILDILMPDMDGMDVCRQVRGRPELADIPIIFLTSRDDEIDRIVGLELGADDYVSKPFSPRELVLRVRAVLRRISAVDPAMGLAGDVAAGSVAETESAARVLSHGRLRMEPELFRVLWDEQPLELTATEFGMLRALLQRPGHVLSRDALMDRAYAGHRVVSDRTIDSHLRRVRAKFAALGAQPIETVHGVGYRLTACQ